MISSAHVSKHRRRVMNYRTPDESGDSFRHRLLDLQPCPFHYRLRRRRHPIVYLYVFRPCMYVCMYVFMYVSRPCIHVDHICL